MRRYIFECQLNKKAIAKDPRYRKPYIQACVMFEKRELSEKSLKVISDLKQYHPMAPKTLNMNSILLAKDRKNDQIVPENFKRIAAVNPKDMLSKYNKGIFYFKKVLE
jgi:hypothetical protein